MSERPGRPLGDRLLGALPLTLAFLWLCVLYWWQAWGHSSPWLFGDELELAQLSRSIAESGKPALRGESHGFQTLYAYLLAPAWWIDDVHGAYATIKYAGVVIMTCVLFPTYALARLLVSKPAALFAAVATAAIPALAYTPFLVEEPLAYPYAALCLFLIVKALASRSRWWLLGAAAACVVAPFVRAQLALLPVVYALGAAYIAWTGERVRRWRSTWSAGDYVGAFVLVTGAAVAFAAVLGRQSTSWQVATAAPFRGRMFEYGLWAAGALTIGLGVLPVVAGLAALVRPRFEHRSRELRAFVGVAAASILCFGLYAATKAAYISTVFANRVVERNLIYLVPLLMVATALWLDRPKLRPVAVAAAAGFAAYVLTTTPYQMEFHFYSDAPGLAILQMANRNLAFTPGTAEWVLLAALGVALVLLFAARLLRRRRPLRRAVVALAALLVLAWTLAGEISAGDASNSFSRDFLHGFPDPEDWIDRETKGAPTMYLGQGIRDPNGVWLLEFWNRSIKYVWSLDNSAPGPGPTVTPNISGRDGRLQQQRGELKYVVTEPGIEVVGDVVAKGQYLAAGVPAEWRLFRIDYPVRLRTATQGVFSDGWMGEQATFAQYSTRSGKPGFALVTISRKGWGGTNVPGNVTIRVGELEIGKDFQPRLGRVTGVRRWVVNAHEERRFVIPAPAPPVRVEVRISPTFVPNDLDPGIGDRRELGAQVGFGFTDRP